MMEKRLAKHTMITLTAEQQARLVHMRELVKEELPDLIRRDQMRKDARDEPTLSGALRRAIHESPHSLSRITAEAGIDPILLDEFLTGERELPSGTLDRIAQAVGFQWPVRKAS